MDWMENTMRIPIGPLYRAALVAVLGMLLISCAASGDRSSDPAVAEAAQQAVSEAAIGTAALPKQDLTDDMMYDILLAEIAGQRGEFEASVAHYLRAATEANDPRVAERAVQIASFAKQYELALRAARRWVTLDPENIEARKTLTVLALETGDMDTVITQVDYLLGITDSPEEGYRMATAILARNTDRQAALAAMQQLVMRHPENPYAWMALSRIAVVAEELDRALEAVDKALVLEENLPAAVILKAQILVRLERNAEATRLLEQAVGAHPADTNLHFAYGRMLLDAEDLEGARKQFARVVKLEPENADGLYSLALLELETKRFRSGEKHLKQLIELDQRVEDAYYYLGYSALEQGNDAAALEWYGKVESGDHWSQAQLRIAEILVRQGDIGAMQNRMGLLRQKNPEQVVEFYLLEGQVLSDAGYHDAAAGVYDTALAANPDNEDLLYARALAAEKQGRLAAAEADMRRILANDPENVRTLNALGYTLADRTDRYEEALSYISRAYASKPDDPAIIDSMGWVQYRLGNLDEARQYLQQAWDMTRDSEIGAHLGEVLWVQGERAAARAIWKASRESNPDNPVLLETVNRLDP
jgi:tetratricopeptide (TPR) repeat protein